MKKPRSCFYCDETMSGKGSQPNAPTKDHVIPRSSMMALSHEMRWEINRHGRNVVVACFDCNHYKGHLRPLDWLLIMPSDVGAGRLRALLAAMGCDPEALASVMSRRLRK